MDESWRPYWRPYLTHSMQYRRFEILQDTFILVLYKWPVVLETGAVGVKSTALYAVLGDADVVCVGGGVEVRGGRGWG